MRLKFSSCLVALYAFALGLIAASLTLSQQRVPAPAGLISNYSADPKTLLDGTWHSYLARFVSADGRTLDRERQDVTTSEGQAYTLLRAAWQRDRDSFDRTLQWTDRNLQMRGDNLFASLWGQDTGGRWSILDKSSNSGADQNIALALLLAARNWPEKQSEYRAKALSILSDLWRKEVITIKNQPYLTAGDWATQQPRPTLNPSYYSPFSYRLFARYDETRSHDWSALLDTSFAVLYGCSELNEPSRLPPDWCGINPETGGYEQPPGDLSSNYGYQAFRVYWQLALDDQWSGSQDGRSREFIQWSAKGANPLDRTETGKAARYDREGQALAPDDSATYAGTLGFLTIAQPAAANNLYLKMLSTYHEMDGGAYKFWDEPLNYYQQNWLWFGVAFYSKSLSLE